MADNFNINTTQQQANEAGGLDNNNPAMTYVDFANTIANNALNQQNQAQLVQQAIERTKQTKLATGQKQAASDLGVNPELKGYLSVDEAVAQLKAAGISDDQIQAFQDSLGDQQMVSQAAVDTVIRKKELSVKTTVAGKKFTTDQDILIPAGMNAKDMGLYADDKNPSIGHVPADGEYQVTIDPQSGQPVSFVPLGETPAEKPAISASQMATKWAQLGKTLHDDVKVGRGTALTQSLMRANRALNYLASHTNLDRQGLMYIQQDIVGIFQGGVPTEEEMKNADYSTAVQKINNLIGQYTGTFGTLKWNSVTAGDKSYVRDQLQQTLLDMRQGITNTIETMIAADAEGYEDIIQADPDRWHRMLDSYKAVIDSGLNKEANNLVNPPATPAAAPAAAPAATPAPAAATNGGPDINALAQALGLKKKVQ